MRQQTLHQLRGILNAYQVPAPRGVLYTRPSRRRLALVQLPVPELQQAFTALCAVLEGLQGQIDALSRRVRRLPREEADVAVLATEIPGIGAQSAATLLAELGDPKRFAGPRAVAAYAGLVPRVSQSADKAHHGRMTKQGNPELRWILSQWAVRLMKDDPYVRAWALRTSLSDSGSSFLFQTGVRGRSPRVPGSWRTHGGGARGPRHREEVKPIGSHALGIRHHRR
jgi:transposase